MFGYRKEGYQCLGAIDAGFDLRGLLLQFLYSRYKRQPENVRKFEARNIWENKIGGRFLDTTYLPPGRRRRCISGRGRPRSRSTGARSPGIHRSWSMSLIAGRPKPLKVFLVLIRLEEEESGRRNKKGKWGGRLVWTRGETGYVNQNRKRIFVEPIVFFF